MVFKFLVVFLDSVNSTYTLKFYNTYIFISNSNTLLCMLRIKTRYNKLRKKMINFLKININNL